MVTTSPHDLNRSQNMVRTNPPVLISSGGSASLVLALLVRQDVDRTDTFNLNLNAKVGLWPLRTARKSFNSYLSQCLGCPTSYDGRGRVQTEYNLHLSQCQVEYSMNRLQFTLEQLFGGPLRTFETSFTLLNPIYWLTSGLKRLN